MYKSPSLSSNLRLECTVEHNMLAILVPRPTHVANYSMPHTEKSSRDEALLCVLDEQSVDQSNSIAHAVCPLSRIAIYIA